MTPDQEMDRVERIAKLLSEPDLRSVRAAREQTEKLIFLLEKQKTNSGLNSEADKNIEKLKRQLRVHVRNENVLAKRAELKKQNASPDTSELD